MDIRETLNRQDYTKLDEFSKQLEGFERLFVDKNLLEMRQELAKINKDEVVGLCSEINGYKIGFMDALALWDSEPDLQAYKELFEKFELAPRRSRKIESRQKERKNRENKRESKREGERE